MASHTELTRQSRQLLSAAQSRPLPVLAAFVVGIALGALIASLVSSDGGATSAGPVGRALGHQRQAVGPPSTSPAGAQQSGDVVRAHLIALASGDYATAWKLLSPRKRHQLSTQPGGYKGWFDHQRAAFAGTDPRGISVQLKSFDRRAGDALVYVTGFRDRRGCDFSGFTWTHYESGRWWYDPGYSTTPARRAVWKPRFAELMGGRCATGG